jgi:hypothetical protein
VKSVAWSKCGSFCVATVELAIHSWKALRAFDASVYASLLYVVFVSGLSVHDESEGVVAM